MINNIYLCGRKQLLKTSQKMKKTLLALLAFFATVGVTAADVVWFDGQHPVSYQVVGKTDPVVKIALQMFESDMLQVTGMRPVAAKKATIRIIQDKGSDDGFRLSVKKGQIVVEGHNGRGAAYGLLELSRMAGVSPWVWWGDVVPERRARLVLDDTFVYEHTPSVAYRGIFINDEDWSLRNWAWKHYENNGGFGQMGPKTYKAVFQLMLRLRANAIWPGMHAGTPGFFTIPGNKEMADSCGILIGTSHCEPLLRNNVDEWDAKVRGPYNYITNREQVQQYWIERLKEVKGSEEFFTIGMRGIHDGSMEGVHTKKEKLEGLQQVIDDQRELIRKYYNKEVEKVPQVFIPYKEVLEILDSGLKVPDDVTLMWCDDNYGYMTRLPDAEQQKRSGGGGVYYHLSYWGRPHDYIWLTTTQPGLVYSEMKAAYDHNCRKLWIVNVHDLKVAAYDLELFLDMAWNINGITPLTLERHLENWLCTQFGEEVGKAVFPAMKELYHLCGIRKPEFMGWTQVELDDRKAYPRGRSHVIDTEFSEKEFGNELDRYLSDYTKACKLIDNYAAKVRPELRDAYFAAIQYPLKASKAMAEKMLYAQKARSRYQGQTDKAMEGREDYMKAMAATSVRAYREIQELTRQYNALSGGKWTGIMNMMPRDLPVFNPPTLPYLPEDLSLKAPSLNTTTQKGNDFIARNACDYQRIIPPLEGQGEASPLEGQGEAFPIQMLGHSMNALSIPKGCEVVYEFSTEREGKAILYTAMIPTQPNDKGNLRYRLTIDTQYSTVISLKEKYRSEFWKQSVLRGQALKQTPVTLTKGKHTLKIKALDDHIICDQWMLDFKKDRKFYVIPVGD
jgi:hypothetical protein